MPNKTNTIGVIVPKLDSYFITSALSGIREVAAEEGYELIITHSRESVEKEIANAQLLFDWQVDGVIASLSVETKSLSHFMPFTDTGIPVVFFDSAERMDHSDIFLVDNTRCGFLATEHLIQQGCRRIALISSSLERNVHKQRFQGFREALKDYTIPFAEELLILGDIDTDGGAAVASLILGMRPMPDGLFFTNDLAAALCMHCLKEAGIRVPEDIAIVGFNNDPLGRLLTPALTTIDYPGVEIGRAAAVSLLDHLSCCHRTPSRTAVVAAELIVRGSSSRGY